MPDFDKLCFHSGASAEVMFGQKSGDYMCDDDCGTPINSQMYTRPTEQDWIDARYDAITKAFDEIFKDTNAAELAEVDRKSVDEEKTEYEWHAAVMPMRFDEYKKRAEAIVAEAKRIGWEAEMEFGTLKGDPRNVLKIRIKKPDGIR